MSLRNVKLSFLKSFASGLANFLMVVALVLSLFGNVSPAMAASPGNQASQQIEIDATPSAVFNAAQQAFEAWPRGEFVKADEDTRVVTGFSRTNLFKFVDDVDVAIAPNEGDPSKTVLSIQSVGRMGEFDFGGNQRNIDEYMDALRALL
ncbi:MAG: DUF1499 domain-containing protein [Synechococcus sp.]